MEKVIAEEIKACKRKEKEDKWAKQVVEFSSTITWIVWKTIGKHVKTQFIVAWTLVVIVEVGDCCHHNFQASFQID
jgi:hypothetical protein